MNAITTQFVVNPLRFVGDNTVVNHNMLPPFGAQGSEWFTLDQVGRNYHLRACPATEGFTAYYLPYIQAGAGGEACIDVPAIGPDHRFVITGALNGCAVVACRMNDGTIRFFHQAGGVGYVRSDVIAEIIYERDYSPNAFCFAWHNERQWILVCQSQSVGNVAAFATFARNRGVITQPI